MDDDIPKKVTKDEMIVRPVEGTEMFEIVFTKTEVFPIQKRFTKEVKYEAKINGEKIEAVTITKEICNKEHVKGIITNIKKTLEDFDKFKIKPTQRYNENKELFDKLTTEIEAEKAEEKKLKAESKVEISNPSEPKDVNLDSHVD